MIDTRDLKGRSAMVTGAGSGIGRATALAFASRGADLFLCDIDEAGLAVTAGEARKLGRRVLSRKVDVANRAEMEAFAAEVHESVRAVDILMNNAGVGMTGGLLDTPLDDWDWIVGINLVGVVHGCHFFIPPMVKRAKGGHVVNLSSAAGYLASDVMNAYATTKFAVFGLSEALRAELAAHSIGVTTVCPGFIITPMLDKMRIHGSEPGLRGRVISLYQRRNYGPDRVARHILDGIRRDRAVLPISPEAWALYYLKRALPGLTSTMSARITAWLG